MARHAQHVRNGRLGKQARQERAIERAGPKKKYKLYVDRNDASNPFKVREVKGA